MRHTSFSFAAELSDEQVQQALRHAGAARFAFNQMLALGNAAYEARKLDASVKVPYSRFDLINGFNAWKVSPEAGVSEDGTVGLPWRREVYAQVFEEALSDLGRAWNNFFEGRKAGRNVGIPQFKKKHHAKRSFRIRNNNAQVRVGINTVKLPKLGDIRLRGSTRKLRRLLRCGPDGKPRAKMLFATLSCTAGRWVLRLNVEAPAFHASQRHTDAGGPSVGIDRGLRTFAVGAKADTREVLRVEAPKPLVQRQRALRRLARSIDKRKQKGSNNHRKARRKLVRLHALIAETRKAFVHVLSSHVVKTHAHVGLEDLHIAGMVKNHCLAKAVLDSALGTFARQVEYKAAWYNCQVTFIGRFFPSTKRCHRCHWVKPSILLKEKIFRCDKCGLEMCRDLNAAINIAQEADRVAEERRRPKTPVEGEALAVACKARRNLPRRRPRVSTVRDQGSRKGLANQA